MGSEKKRVFTWGRLFKGIMVFILAWTIWTVWPALTYRKIEPKHGVVQKGLFLKGGYHMHTRYSDGMGTVADLAREAGMADLDWIILTDHGGPNRGSENTGGWYEDVLIVGASELSSDAGHLVVIGSDTGYKLPLEPQLAIDELNYRNGMTFIAHPYDDKIPWTDWTVERFSGIEIFSLYESVKNASWNRLLQFPLQYLINKNYAILRALTYPEMSLGQWKRLNRERKSAILGIYALDAHGRIPLTKKTSLPFPSYESMFSTLTVYIPAPSENFYSMSPAAATQYILTHLKKADYFNVIESMASADGISMKYEQQDSSSWRFSLVHPFEKLLCKIFRNGELFHESIAANEMHRELTATGRYHAELYLPDHPFAALPWLIGNPVDIPAAASAEIVPSEDESSVPAFFTTVPPLAYTLEKNDESYGELLIDESADTLVPFTVMRYSLRIPIQGNDSWCSSAVRDPENLEKFVRNGDGIYAEISGNRRSTVWLEIRTSDVETGGENWFRHSIVLDREKKCITIPYSRMTRIYGSADKIAPETICALFLSVNGSTDYIPCEGEIIIHQLGSYLEKETKDQS